MDAQKINSCTSIFSEKYKISLEIFKNFYKIYFDKEEFTEYKKEQNEYTVNVDAKTLYYPFIDVITNDSSSKTEVTYPKTFPGKVTIDVTSSGGETNTIGINFVREKEQITDYIIN